MLANLKIALQHFMQHYRKQILILFDVVGVGFAYIITWMLIAGRAEMTKYISVMVASCFFFICCFVVIYYLMGMYDSLWRYAEIVEFFRFCVAAVLAVVVFSFSAYGMFFREKRAPLALYVISSVLAAMVTLIMRLTYRMYRNTRIKRVKATSRRTLLIGAGDAAATLLHEKNKSNNNELNFICVVDDDERKVGRSIMGIAIMGTTKDIPELVERCDIETILLAIPTLEDIDKQRILGICNKTRCNLRILPDIVKMIADGKELTSRIRDVRVEDLLGRDVVSLTQIQNRYITDSVVMVTGGGGSIGSELCRQIAQCNPKQLVVVDIYENNAYAIQQELLRKYGDKLDMQVRIASVRDSKKVEELFKFFKPDIVFHAAAHKHVPLMEDAPEEAVKNNVFGTFNIATCAEKYGAKRFILISTDKAVNPTNVMGATKRVCEMIVQTLAQKSKTTAFVAVRFGNVLGSNGSVLPLFKEQIAQGGPVTVTHQDIVRYFMTIPEAVSLVMEAGFMGESGNIFVLDMGKPVKILELAENLIKLAGFIPYRDIKI
ncbi:MAG: nucleoside-diphosphate sugar epimerase/dehydratase, partial [Oscillospiraceae bacterium]